MDKVTIVNNVNGHFRVEEQKEGLLVTKELRYQWLFDSNGMVRRVSDLRTGHTLELEG